LSNRKHNRKGTQGQGEAVQGQGEAIRAP
jgi:hypothetical protein